MSDVLRGIIVGDDRDTLVIQASPEDVRHFASRDEVELRRRRAPEQPDPFRLVGQTLYHADGRAAGVITDARLTSAAVEVTSTRDEWAHYVRRRCRVTFTVEAILP